jgi:hypothetical protein
MIERVRIGARTHGRLTDLSRARTLGPMFYALARMWDMSRRFGLLLLIGTVPVRRVHGDGKDHRTG